MNLARFPRRHYTAGRTPIEKMDRLSTVLGGPDLYIKRDDLLGLAAGGNKTRKLEFVVADSIEKRADTLVTCGAVQSNHCRLTLAAALKEGMECRLVLEERVAGSYKEDASGNHFLYRLLGAKSIRVVPGGSDMMMAMEEVSEEARTEGRSPYIIPGGASNALGALGYVACAQEILSQIFENGPRIDHVVCASGSAGTHAGLVTGLWDARSGISTVGINVSRSREAQEDLVYQLVRRVASLVRVDKVPRNEVRCYDEYVGAGYSRPTPLMAESVRLFARCEGILLDPVYTGKAAAGLIDLTRKGFFRSGENVLFLHTGGSPALYAYPDDVLD